MAILSLSFLALAQAPPTIEQGLAAHGIGTSPEELIRALKSSSADVRGMAAMQLAEEKYPGARPALETTLRSERDPQAIRNIAYPLFLLGDSEGANALAGLCGDDSLRDDLRLEVAHILLNGGDDTCFSDVIRILDRSDVPSMQSWSLEYLNKSPADAHRAADLDRLARVLGRTIGVPELRLDSAACIARFKLVQDTRQLADAISAEHDPAKRATLRRYAEGLRNGP